MIYHLYSQHVKLVIITTMLFVVSLSASANQSVLILHSYHEEHVWTGMVKQGIDNTLSSVDHLSVHHEYMDTKRFPLFSYKTAFLSYLQKKYSMKNFDVIVVVDDDALHFIRNEAAQTFTKIPVVYLGINKIDPELIDKKGYTGVFENRDIANAIFDIKTLTGSDELIVITDKTLPGIDNLTKLKVAQHDSRSPNKIYIFNSLKQKKVFDKLSEFNKNIPIFKIGQIIDSSKNGALLSWNDGTYALTSNLNNPVFTLSSTSLSYGAVGISVLNGVKHGEQGAWFVKRILDGTSINELPPKTSAISSWTFNWQQMKRYSYPENRIPFGSYLINKDETFYEKNKLLVLGAIGILIVALLIIGLLIEIIRRGHQTRTLLSDNENRYKQLAKAGANVFWEIDREFKLTYLSGNTDTLLGQTTVQLQGRYFGDVLQKQAENDFPIEKAEQLLKRRLPIDHFIFKRRVSRGKIKILVINGGPMFDKHNKYTGYRGICNDVTVEHHLTEKLAYQAEYDALTGLINRERFLLYLKKSVNKSAALSSFICFLDLDRFKLVNDTAGHLVGDAMLTKIAVEISACISEEDILGRLGGDEFGLLLINKSREQALSVCESIVKKINYFQFQWNDKTFSVGISIGIVPINSGVSEIEMLSKADICCYKAKELGRNRVYFADENNAELDTETLQMGYIANITQAIKNNQFYLVKQPIVAAKVGGAYTHYEVLLRFNDDKGNNVSPVTFIPAAEKYGVITLIDYWVVNTVFENYSDYFLPDTLVSINLSGLSLSNEGFIKKLTRLVTNSPIDCCNICFEITETAVISNLSSALEFISHMKALGIKFALDDFGSGASSFGYLKQLPVDYLKIDGSLVKNMLSEPVDRAIIQSIHEVAKMMGMKTIAEFVENKALRIALADIGIDLVQGYGIGKPIPCKEVNS